MLRPTSSKLLNRFTRLDGCHAMGFLTTAAMPTSGVVSMPIRLLKVLRPSVLYAGNVLSHEDGSKILLMEAEQQGGIYQVFQAALVTQAFNWERRIQNTHPVTHMKIDGMMSQMMGEVYAYFDRPVDAKLEDLITSRYQFFTGQDVQVGDKVGTKTVSKVVPIAGVKLVFAE